MHIKFQVSNQIIKRTDVNRVVADSRNYLYASFSFSEEWQGVKTAIFKNGDMVKHVILINDECLVPWEVIKQGKLRVSVFCGDLITADEDIVYISPSGYEDGGEPEEPTPEVYQQIIKMIEEIEVGGVTEDKIEKAVNKYIGQNPIETLTEQDVQKIVSDYVSAHKEELKGDTGSPGRDGKDGQNGEHGYTPVKGTDYWTAEDIAEIQSYIDNQIGGALNGTY